jgi:hypothetical protein
MRVLPAGGSSDLARLARTPEWDLYELPQGRGGSAESALEIQGYAGREYVRWLIGLEGARTRFEKSTDREHRESTESIAVFDWWNAFDDLLALGDDPDGAINWGKVVGWLGQQSEWHEPRRALIVEIAERLGSSIGHRARHLRRILLRHRDVVPVRRIQHLDQECLRWYIRQPGESLAEKAGHRQEIMSVVRRETFDTLENRVLKDFLRRCVRESGRYSRRFQKDFPNSERVLLVKRFAVSCKEALRFPEFDDVRRPRPDAQANYVLQSDARYREVWHWYQKLLRNQDSEEQIWNWQGRLWADVCRLLVGASCQVLIASASDRSKAPLSSSTAPFYVEPKGALGSRLADSWAPGPFVIRQGPNGRSVLSIIDSDESEEHEFIANLSGLGGHAYVLMESVDRPENRRLLVIWAINAMASNLDSEPEEASASAARALSRMRRQLSAEIGPLERLDGLILMSRLGDQNESLSSFSRGDDVESQVSVNVIGSEPKCWDDGVLEIAAGLEQWL